MALGDIQMIELIILMGLAWLLRNWMETPTEQDMCDYIVMDEFQVNGDE